MKDCSMKNMKTRLGIVLLIILQNNFSVAAMRGNFLTIEERRALQHKNFLDELLSAQLTLKKVEKRENHYSDQPIQCYKKQRKGDKRKYVVSKTCEIQSDIALGLLSYKAILSENEQDEIVLRASRYEEYLKERAIDEAKRAQRQRAINIIEQEQVFNYSRDEQVEILRLAEEYLNPHGSHRRKNVKVKIV